MTIKSAETESLLVSCYVGSRTDESHRFACAVSEWSGCGQCAHSNWEGVQLSARTFVYNPLDKYVLLHNNRKRNQCLSMYHNGLLFTRSLCDVSRVLVVSSCVTVTSSYYSYNTCDASCSKDIARNYFVYRFQILKIQTKLLIR